MSGVTVGIRLEGTIFSSNSALIGGGVYSTGSGTAVTQDIDGIPAQNPTTLIGCEFIGNGAKTGGAIYSGAGRDMIVNTSFVRNSAFIGGALRLVGTTSLNGCKFVKNLSGDDEGPGISNDGVIADLSHCSFVDNGFNCRTEFFLDHNDVSLHMSIVYATTVSCLVYQFRSRKHCGVEKTGNQRHRFIASTPTCAFIIPLAYRLYRRGLGSTLCAKVVIHTVGGVHSKGRNQCASRNWSILPPLAGIQRWSRC